VHTSASYVGDRADRSFDPTTFAAQREELPGYLLWTLGGAWSLLEADGGRPSVSLSVRAENLLDEAYQEAWGFRAPGRQLYFGVSLGLGGGN
jgi:outer membrane cobalamin receptor